MTNPEMTPSLCSICAEIPENTFPDQIIGVKQEDLSEEVVKIVTDAYTLATGSVLPSPWIFTGDRIKHEFMYGRNILALELPTAIGTATLSVKNEEGMFVFDFSLHKDADRPSLRSYCQKIEQRFRNEANQGLIELEKGQKIRPALKLVSF